MIHVTRSDLTLFPRFWTADPDRRKFRPRMREKQTKSTTRWGEDTYQKEVEFSALGSSRQIRTNLSKTVLIRQTDQMENLTLVPRKNLIASRSGIIRRRCDHHPAVIRVTFREAGVDGSVRAKCSNGSTLVLRDPSEQVDSSTNDAVVILLDSQPLLQ